jgi:ABC-2 type transport system ATP-binding protein
VLVSSHVLAEVEQTVDDVVIISGGRLIRSAPLAQVLGSAAAGVTVVTPARAALEAALVAAGLAARRVDDRTLAVSGATPEQVGHLAFAAGVEVHGLTAEGDDLESTFLRLVGDGRSGEPVTGLRGPAAQEGQVR